MKQFWITKVLASSILILLLFSCAGLEFGSGTVPATGSEGRASKPVEPGPEDTKPEQGIPSGSTERLSSSSATSETASDLEELRALRFVNAP